MQTPTLKLSPREAQIVRLAAEGHTNKEIGQMLFISPHTVDSFIRRAHNKLGTNRRITLVRSFERCCAV